MKLLVKNMRKMKCPRCGGRLRPVDIKGIALDACSDCSGVWFDNMEIETLLRSRRDLSFYVSEEERKWKDSELNCPVCTTKMRQLQASSVFPFDIDICPKDKGYWFDDGELDQVVAAPKRKPLQLAEIDISKRDKPEEEILQRQVARIKRRSRKLRLPSSDAPTLSDASFFGLSRAQQILAFIGLPAESGRLYDWKAWMNLSLIFANTAVFVLMVLLAKTVLALLGVFPREWYMQYGMIPDRVAADPIVASYTFITSMFIHGGIIHLFGNMFFLFTTGDDVEKRLGHFRFLLFYLAAGVIADIASIIAGVGPAMPHVGASGAISGVMGAYLALCNHKSFYIWLFRIGIFGKIISVSAWLYLVLWFGMQLLSVKCGSPNVGYWAHIGGFVFGYIVGKIVKSKQQFNAYSGEWEWAGRR